MVTEKRKKEGKFTSMKMESANHFLAFTYIKII